ncbi:DUF2061 domain-containing protein [Gammaproteobacteria bacterium]
METNLRSLLKAATWRITGTLDTFFISWFLTGKPALAVSIAITEVITKVSLYFLHERAWNRVQWGIKRNHG